MGLSNIFKKMGWYTDFVMLDMIPPHIKLKKKKNDKEYFTLVNKKYVSDPDFVIGDIAGGLSESVEKKNLTLNEDDGKSTATHLYNTYIKGKQKTPSASAISREFELDTDSKWNPVAIKSLIKKHYNLKLEDVNESTAESKLSQQLFKKVGKDEIKFYDELEILHTKLGHSKYMKWLSNALLGYNVDMKQDTEINNKAEAEEALYNVSK